MKGGARVALALVAGYYLGRRHKLRLALTLALAGVVKKLRAGQGGEGGLVQEGMKALGSSPELEKITGRIREELLEVGKAAAVAATSRQIDSLSDKLHERAEALRHVPGAEDVSKAAGEGVSKATGEARERAGKLREKAPFKGRAPVKDEEEDYEEGDYEEDQYEEERPEKKPESRRERPAQRVGGERR